MNAMFIKCHTDFNALPNDTFGLLCARKAADRKSAFCDIVHVAKRQTWSKKRASVQPRAVGKVKRPNGNSFYVNDGQRMGVDEVGVGRGVAHALEQGEVAAHLRAVRFALLPCLVINHNRLIVF